MEPARESLHVRANRRVVRHAALVSVFAILFAVGGCGGGGSSTSSNQAGSGQGSGDRGSGNQGSSGDQPRGIVGTQPGAPCRPVPDELVKRIERHLNSSIKVGNVWQMVHATNLHKLGLDDPYFVSARVTVTPDPATYASWTVQDPKRGAVIPLDGPAKTGTDVAEDVDPDAYSALVTNADYTKSRACAQAQYELKQQARQQ